MRSMSTLPPIRFLFDIRESLLTKLKVYVIYISMHGINMDEGIHHCHMISEGSFNHFVIVCIIPESCRLRFRLSF